MVNGPKSWSLAAALHPDIAAAYDAAQDRAACQVIAWLSRHATTRVGPRGGQAQLPLQVLEAVTIRHFTSRANDPHRHLHLQFSSRVFAAGKWRGLHTVGVRDVINAVNGVGHAAMDTDQEWNAALAAHGYTKDSTGEIRQLAAYVGPMSARAAQIERTLDRYERDWTAAHPGQAPGPALRRAWHKRAWAEGRPDKVRPQRGASLEERWRSELDDLGFRAPTRPVALVPTPIGALDRDGLVGRAIARLAAGRSAWNAADVRGEVERLIAAAGTVVQAGVRQELAEDLTARAMNRCVPLLDREGVPEHIRAWTSRRVLAVEAELTARLAARTAEPSPRELDAEPTPLRPAPAAPLTRAPDAGRLDPGQAAAVTTLAGDRALVVVEGAAGAGKTTTLAATRAALAERGCALVVVTPTKKAAAVAAAEIGTAAGSAAWLAHQHGWRWNDDGTWTRLTPGAINPATGRVYAGPTEAARLRPGDLLVIDEAGMADQDTTLALVTIADECRARVALLGDRHQLPAVGRGGVLDLAVAQVDPAAHLTLSGLHRFTRPGPDGRPVPDTDYADLTLAMRTGHDPGAVFDTLLSRGQIRVHPDPKALQEELATHAAAAFAAGEPVGVVVDTREQAGALNAAIRDRLVDARRVRDDRAVITAGGQRVGVGDLVTTRRNDRDLDVANRDTWTVTAIAPDGGLHVTPARARVTPGRAPVTPTAARQRRLPADYVTAHLELGYATTAHGTQGDTVPTAHLVVGEHTGAAAAYVGMTRGQRANTAHLLATDLEQAREQWITVFTRDHADLGPAHAAGLAATEADRYAPPRPLQQVLADLHAAWATEQHCLDRLAIRQRWCDRLRESIALDAPHVAQRAHLEAARDQAAFAAQQAHAQVAASAVVIDGDTDRRREELFDRWDGDRGAARAAAQVVRDGPGRLGLRRGAVTRAGEQLTAWADQWRPHLPALPVDVLQLAHAASWFDDRPGLWRAFDATARRQAEQAHPGHAALRVAADTARHQDEQAGSALLEAYRQRDQRLRHLGLAARAIQPEAQLAELGQDLAATRQKLTDIRARIASLTAERLAIPERAHSAPPTERLAQEHDAWRTRWNNERAAHRARAATAPASGSSTHPSPPPPTPRPPHAGTPGMGR